MIRKSTWLTALLVAVLSGLAACGPAEVADEAPAAAAPDSAEFAGLPTASPDSVGMSAAGLDRIRPAMQAYVDDGRVAGVMTLVARRGQVVNWDAVGLRDVEAADPLEADDIFRIYSMTNEADHQRRDDDPRRGGRRRARLTPRVSRAHGHVAGS